jgi:hypothetical protein
MKIILMLPFLLASCGTTVFRLSESGDMEFVNTTGNLGIIQSDAINDDAGITALPVGSVASARTMTSVEASRPGRIQVGSIVLEGPIDHSSSIREVSRGVGRVVRIGASAGVAEKLIEGTTSVAREAIR